MVSRPVSYRLPVVKTLLALLALAVLVGLGTWQIQRLSWKQDLMARLEQQEAQAPAPLPQDIKDANALEYSRVILRGRFIHDREMLLKPRVQNGVAGYHVLTPLRETTGRVVIVDRGFIDDKGLVSFPRPAGIQKVLGTVTLPRKGYFTPDNTPDKNDWYWADIPAMTTGFQKSAPVMVSTAAVMADVPNNHLQYAFFWFAMAGLLVLFFILSERSEWKTKNG